MRLMAQGELKGTSAELMQQMEEMRAQLVREKTDTQERLAREKAEEVTRLQKEGEERVEKLEKEKKKQEAELQRELAHKTAYYERALDETKEEAELKWSKAADEIKDSLAAAEIRDREINAKAAQQAELEADLVRMRKKAAKASSAAAEGIAVAGTDWSDRRRRLMGWKAGLMRASIPAAVFESRPSTSAGA